jgi:hypothetical protein
VIESVYIVHWLFGLLIININVDMRKLIGRGIGQALS